MKVYDVFLYHDEAHLLDLRFAEHDPFVDHFVVMEGDHTHNGQPHELSFDIDSPRWAPYRAKIIHLRAKLKPAPASSWENEAIHRNAFVTALKLQDNDIVHLADVDEITSRFHWKRLIEEVKERECMALWHRFFYYFLNLESSQPWHSARMFQASYLKKFPGTPDEMRKRPFPSTATPCGWHFSFLMTPERIAKKISSYAHTEYDNADYNTPEKIQQALRAKSDIFRRPGFHYTVCRMDESWPIAIQRTPDEWEKFVCARSLKDAITEARRRIRKVASRIKHGRRDVVIPEPPAGAHRHLYVCAAQYVKWFYPELAVSGARPLADLLADLRSYVAEGTERGFVALPTSRVDEAWLATLAASVFHGMVVCEQALPASAREKILKIGMPDRINPSLLAAAA